MRSLAELPPARAVLLDVAPRALLSIAGDRLPPRYRNALRRFRYGAGVCKVDFALSGPVPWTNEACRRAGTLHLGGTWEEIAAAEEQVDAGQHPDAPYVLVTQPGVADPSRAPAGGHTLWTYCHVPAGSTVDMTGRIEAQIERFAPGFRDLVLARHTLTAADEEAQQPQLRRRRHRRRAAGHPADRVPPGGPVEPVPHPRPRPVPVLLVHPAAARRARPVRRTGCTDRTARRVRHPPPARAGASPAGPGRRGPEPGVTSGTAPLPGSPAQLAPRVTAGVLASLVLVLTGTVVAEAALGHTSSSNSTGVALTVMLWVIAAVGLVVAWHQPGNAIGWLMLAAPVLLLMIFASQSYIQQSYRPGHHALPVLGPVALVIAQQFFVFFVPFPLVILLFPDGRLPSARWRWAVWLYLALCLTAPLTEVGVTIAVIASHTIHVLPDDQLAQVQNPSAGLAWTNDVGLLFFAGLAGGWIAALCRQVSSWRHASGERRQQLKWLMSGAAVCGVFIITSIATNSSLWAVLMLGAAALPVSIGVGILKYRLYDIDRIISRTLAYALVTGLLVGVYAGLVLLATQVLGFASPVAVAVSTLAAAALFTPVRRRVQRAVDRRFNRARYDADTARRGVQQQAQGRCGPGGRPGRPGQRHPPGPRTRARRGVAAGRCAMIGAPASGAVAAGLSGHRPGPGRYRRCPDRGRASPRRPGPPEPAVQWRLRAAAVLGDLRGAWLRGGPAEAGQSTRLADPGHRGLLRAERGRQLLRGRRLPAASREPAARLAGTDHPARLGTWHCLYRPRRPAVSRRQAAVTALAVGAVAVYRAGPALDRRGPRLYGRGDPGPPDWCRRRREPDGPRAPGRGRRLVGRGPEPLLPGPRRELARPRWPGRP